MSARRRSESSDPATARTSAAAFASANSSPPSPSHRIGAVRRSVFLLVPSIAAAAFVGATPPSVAFSHRRTVADAGGFAFATAAPALPLAVRPPSLGNCAGPIHQDAEVAVSGAQGGLSLGLGLKGVGGYRETKRTVLSSVPSFDVNECDPRIVSTRGGNVDWTNADFWQRYKPYQHGVVLLGAYEHCFHSHDDIGVVPGSSGYWDRLLPYLDGTAAAPDVRDVNDEQESLFCYAPAMPGTASMGPSGATKNRASWGDWLAHGREATILAKTISDRVTIVGHSVGALVAAAISEETDVDRLVLTGPNFLPSPGNKRIKKRGNSLLGNLLNSLQAIRRTFSGRETSHDVPLHFLRETFRLQERLARQWKVHEIVVVMGAEDCSVGSLSEQIDCISRFVPDNAKVEVHTVKDAGHDLCLEGEQALQELAEVISRPPLEEHAFFSIRE